LSESEGEKCGHGQRRPARVNALRRRELRMLFGTAYKGAMHRKIMNVKTLLK
jgi:hypothetical protein